MKYCVSEQTNLEKLIHGANNGGWFTLTMPCVCLAGAFNQCTCIRAKTLRLLFHPTWCCVTLFALFFSPLMAKHVTSQFASMDSISHLPKWKSGPEKGPLPNRSVFCKKCKTRGCVDGTWLFSFGVIAAVPSWPAVFLSCHGGGRICGLC